MGADETTSAEKSGGADLGELLPVLDSSCCGGGECGPASGGAAQGVSRRGFIALGASAAAAVGLWPGEVFAVPAEKNLSRTWLDNLAARGAPTEFTGAALARVGMPAGGACAGQVYLSGDGRLWLWDIFNPDNFPYGGADWEGVHYADPIDMATPFTTGFALRWTGSDGAGDTRRMDASGFEDVRFRGRYPIGHVTFTDQSCPLDVALEAFSPFIPTRVADSSLPATIFEYTVHNRSGSTVDAELLGLSENPVCIRSRSTQPIVLTGRDGDLDGGALLSCSAIVGEVDSERPEVEFEDWESGTYDGWTVEGTAFGEGPVTEAEAPDYFRREGDLNVTGQRFVTSHNWRDGGPPADDHTGRMISAAFTIDRRYLVADIGGGGDESGAGLHLVVDGEVIAQLTGPNSEVMQTRSVDVSAHEGRTATIELVDNGTGGWGHINCDRIRFSDVPVDERPIEELPDGGTFALAAFDPHARARPSIADWSTPEAWFDSGDGPAEIDAANGRQAGTVTVPIRLAPGESRTVRYALSWHFANVNDRPYGHIERAAELRRHYGEIYEDAPAVLADLAARGDELADATRTFARTWYDDSTLPHWFLERTLVPASTLATNTCLHFDDGRFYGWEGIYCCPGTCTHVWNYAQSVARLFPELERDTRERVDFGLGFHEDTGAIDFRGEADRNVAVDGQSGNILRTYREHQMAADSSFLDRVWPQVRKATGFLIGLDGEPDGIIEGRQHNTLDADWYGEIPWISGLYVAALRAAAEMADDAGDTEFARRCRSIADRGSAHLDGALWNDEYGYYEHEIDPDHADATNSNRGCHIDQMFGQTYAHQLGLDRVFGAENTGTALESLFRNNFLPDAQAYKDESGIEGGRVYSTEGEAGTLMCTWPFGGADTAPGDGEPTLVAYFNEVWTGQEYQFAAHLMAEGMVDEALAVTRAVHDRYSTGTRNPYNEIECSDHYARAMMSHAVHLAASGYEYHGPRGHLGFAPKLSPDDFAAAFTVAEGWGLYRQHRSGARQESDVEMRFGRVELRSFAVEAPERASRRRVTAEKVAQRRRPIRLDVSEVAVDGRRVMVTLTEPVELSAGESLVVRVR